MDKLLFLYLYGSIFHSAQELLDDQKPIFVLLRFLFMGLLLSRRQKFKFKTLFNIWRKTIVN